MKTSSIADRIYALHKKHERLWWMLLFALGVLATFVLAYTLGSETKPS